MAYFDPANVFSQLAAFPVPAPADVLSSPLDGRVMADEPASFEHTEWAVIALARQDGLATLRQPRRSKLSAALLGRPRSFALAAERLEALRRLAVEAWHRPLAISLPSLGAFIAAGFTSAQLALLLSTTGALPAIASLVPPATPIANAVLPSASLRKSA